MSRLPAILCALLLSACSGSPGTPQPSASETSSVIVLPAGKADLPLTPGTYLAPDGFVPALALAVPAGWSSAHRGDDAFDLAMTDPTKGAPLVAVVFVTPLGTRVAESLQAIRRRATGRATPATGMVAGLPATGFDLFGGTGQLLASPSGTIALDAAPHQRIRVLGTDVDGVPLVVAIVVPDGSRWAQVFPAALALLAGVRPA